MITNCKITLNYYVCRDQPREFWIQATGKHIPGLFTWMDGSLVFWTKYRANVVMVAAWNEGLTINTNEKANIQRLRTELFRALCEVQGGKKGSSHFCDVCALLLNWRFLVLGYIVLVSLYVNMILMHL